MSQDQELTMRSTARPPARARRLLSPALARPPAPLSPPAASLARAVSASIPQLIEAIAELQGKGYALPDFPANPSRDSMCEERREGLTHTGLASHIGSVLAQL